MQHGPAFGLPGSVRLPGNDLRVHHLLLVRARKGMQLIDLHVKVNITVKLIARVGHQGQLGSALGLTGTDQL